MCTKIKCFGFLEDIYYDWNPRMRCDAWDVFAVSFHHPTIMFLAGLSLSAPIINLSWQLLTKVKYCTRVTRIPPFSSPS
jgi:hypothetical protein